MVDETGEILGESLHSQKDVHLRWVAELYYIRDDASERPLLVSQPIVGKKTKVHLFDYETTKCQNIHFKLPIAAFKAIHDAK